MDEIQLRQVMRGHSPDGLTVLFKFVGKDDRECSITLPANKVADLILDFETEAALAFETRKTALKGTDPRQFDPVPAISCRRIDVMATVDGKIALGIVTDKGMPLTLGMDRARAEALVARIQSTLSSDPPSKPS